MAGLFDYKDVKNKPSRSGFDLSNKVAFTAKAGELLPAYWKLVNPGDTFRFGVEHITRTQPVNSAAFTRIREYFDWFFVPIRLLWKSWPTFITQMSNNPVQASSFTGSQNPGENSPHFMLSTLVSCNGTLTTSTDLQQSQFVFDHLRKQQQGEGDTAYMVNSLGFDRSFLWSKLCHHLGYFRTTDALCTLYNSYIDTPAKMVHAPYISDMPVSAFPLAAYHKIYNDYYRFDQWEKSSPFLWNFDYLTEDEPISLPVGTDASGYWDGFTMFDLHYANYNKDLFMGLLPNQQYGEASEIRAVMSNGVLSGNLGVGTYSNGDWNPFISDVVGSNVSLSVKRASSSPEIRESPVVTSPSGADVVGSSYFSVLALRQGEALQRWKEVAQAGDQSYRDQIFRHFGVSLPEELSDLCAFLGGDSSNIDISEVVNQSLDGDSQTDIKGKGIGVSRSSNERTFKEHGILMCVYHAKPLLDYDITGIDMQLPLVNVNDFFIPEMDRIGMEELPFWALQNADFNYDTQTTTNHRKPFTLGYVPRYYQYKTSIDRVLGAFSDTLNYWVAPVDNEQLVISDILGDASSGSQITYNFFKVNPHLLDNIFGFAANDGNMYDQLLINAYFNVKAVRNMDYNGLPY